MSFLPSPATPTTTTTATIPKPKMGKKKSDIYSCFQILPMKNKANKSIFMCKFCDRQYLQNATKMESHIVTQCQKVPPDVRISYAKVPGGGGSAASRQAAAGGGGSANMRGMTMTSSPANSDSTNSNSDSRPETPVNLSQFAAANRARMTHHQQAMNNNSRNSMSMGGSSGLVVKRAVGALMAQLPRGSQQHHSRHQVDSQYAGNADVYQQQRTNLNNLQSNTPHKRPRLVVDGMGMTNHHNHNQQNNNSSKISRNHAIGNNHHGITMTSSTSNNNYYQSNRQHQLGNNVNNNNKRASIMASATSMSGSHFGSNNNREHIIMKSLISKGNSTSIGNNNTARMTAKKIATAAASANVDHSAPSMDHQEMVNIWRLLARGIYATGCPVSLFENEYWTEAFKKLRPALSLPTTYALSNTLLGEEFGRVKQNIINNKINECNFVTLQCESHPGNSPEEQILCFFVTTPSPVLCRFLPVKTDEISSSGSLMKPGKLAEIIISTIDDIGSTKVLAFISDLKKSSSCEIKSSWECLRSKYPGLITFGCIFQGLNFLLDSFLEDEPSIRDICQKGKFIVDRTRGSPVLKRRFQEIQRQLKLAPAIGLKFSSRSKYSSLAKCLALLISQKAAFQQLISNCEEEAQEAFLVHENPSLVDGVEGFMGMGLTSSYEELLKVTEDEDFWNGIESVTNIIVPLCNWIKILEPESSPSISQLPQIFHELKSAFDDNLSNLPQETETDTLIQLFNQTKRLCVNELHYAACLLNPKLKLQGVLTEDEEEEGSEFIHYFCETRDFDAPSALKQLSDYRKNVGFFAKPSVWQLAETLDPIAWWQNVRPGSSLGSVAVLLLAVSPSLCTFDPKALLGSVPSSNFQGEGGTDKLDKMEKLAFLKHHLGKSKVVSIQPSAPRPSSSEGLSTKNSKDWSPQPDFKLEDDQEPMDVTQFLSQTTQPDGYSESEGEDNDVEDIQLENPSSILSSLMMRSPDEILNNNNEDKKLVLDEVEDEDNPLLANSVSITANNGETENDTIENDNNENDDNDDDSSSSDSDGSSSGSSSSSSSTKTESSATSKTPNVV